jgi:protein-tyrosine phosphatase
MHAWKIPIPGTDGQPLAAGELWQADLLGMIERPADVLISCTILSELAEELAVDRQTHIFFPFADAPILPDVEAMARVCFVAALAFVAGKTIVVNCNAGCNRSGLIVGRIMYQLSQKDIVARIRAVHPEALSNDVFAAYLEGLR